MEIWINPACSKCRTATTALDEAGISYTVRRYLDDPPTAEEFTEVLSRLNLDPWHAARLNEPAATLLTNLPRDPAHRADWIAIMVANPTLIQRPIITTDDNTSFIARDPETLSGVLNA